MGIPTLDEGGPDDKIIVKTDMGFQVVVSWL